MHSNGGVSGEDEQKASAYSRGKSVLKLVKQDV